MQARNLPTEDTLEDIIANFEYNKSLSDIPEWVAYWDQEIEEFQKMFVKNAD
jgi:hypothetical protein